MNYKHDSRIREIFQKQLPQAPSSPWFTRKVMNRLPEKKAPACSWIEYAAYIVASLLLIAFWGMFCAGVKASGVITGGDIINLMALAAVTIVLAASFISPRFRHWLRDS